MGYDGILSCLQLASAGSVMEACEVLDSSVLGLRTTESLKLEKILQGD